jgi:DNA-binding transcriptional ArsR family regulator
MSALTLTEIETLSQSLKLMANPNRLRILIRLLDGELSVGSIETELDIRQPGLSRELANLRDAGAIQARRESKVVFYSIGSDAVRSLLLRILGADMPARQPQSPLAQPDFDPRPKFRFYPSPNDHFPALQGDPL